MTTPIRGNTQIMTGTVSRHQVDSTLIRADGVNPFTADQSMGSHRLTNLLDPSNPQDAVTKNYADGLSGGTPYNGTPADVASAGASGSSALYSRGDHIHKGVHSLAATGSSSIFGDALLAPGRGIDLVETGQQISILSNVTGTSPYDSTPADIANAGAAGTSLLQSHGDHIHRGLHSIQATGSAPMYGDAFLIPGIGIDILESGTILKISSNITGTSPYDSTPADVAGAGAAGTSLLQSHGDHVHRGLHSAQITGSSAIYNDLYFIAGSGITLTQSGQVIEIIGTGGTPSDTTPADVTDTPTAGVSTDYSRGDHAHKGVHSIRVTGSAAMFGDAYLIPGDNITLFQSGHNIKISGAGATGTVSLSDANPQDVAATAAPGTDSIASRDDHVHKGLHSLRLTGSSAIFGDAFITAGRGITILETSPVLEISSNVTGTSPYDSTPADVGSAGAAGTSLLQSHGDHVHKGVRSISATGSAQLFGDTLLQGLGSIYIGQSGQIIYVSGTTTAGGSLTVQETDGSPSVAASILNVSNDSMTDNGGGNVSVETVTPVINAAALIYANSNFS